MFKKGKKISQHGFIITSVLIYITGVIIYSFWSYYSQKHEIISQVNKKLYKAAISLDYLLPQDYNDRAINPDTIPKIEFYEITDLLSKQSENLGVKYIYSVVLYNGKIYFTTSSATSEEMLTNENLTYYWQEYTEADTSFYNSFNRDFPTFSEYTDRWGTFRTIIIPKTNHTGRKYLLCADMEISFIRETLIREVFFTLAKTLFLLIIVIPFVYILFINYRKYSTDLEEKVIQRTMIMEEEILKRKKLKTNFVNPKKHFLFHLIVFLFQCL